MNRLLLIITLLVAGLSVQAQNKKNIKTKVLVVGNKGAAVAAALQAAISGVSTTLITSEQNFDVVLSASRRRSGLEAEFLKKTQQSGDLIDTPTIAGRENKAVMVNYVIKTWADSTHNLELITNAGWNKFNRSAEGWVVRLDDGRTIRADVLVYATKKNLSDKILFVSSKSSETLDYTKEKFRTSIAGQNYNGSPSFKSLYSLLKPEEENLVIANADDADMATGQAAGATAAYAAFFNTKTSLVNLKITQGELLKYKSALLPFDDVLPADTNWQAIQKIGISGILKAEIKEGSALFLPDQPVTAAEIKQPIKDLYYKAQIWFDDHANSPVTLENTIAMVCYVGNKSPENTREGIEKSWKTKYNFTTGFDLKKVLTRREFAAVVSDYLNPFIVTVDKAGHIIR